VGSDDDRPPIGLLVGSVLLDVFWSCVHGGVVDREGVRSLDHAAEHPLTRTVGEPSQEEVGEDQSVDGVAQQAVTVLKTIPSNLSELT
jgi:hypothetical protein